MVDSKSPGRVYSIQEISEHNSKEDCWCIIHGKVYDLTSFLSEHPGGSSIILKYAGKDATKAFDPIHPPDIIEKLLPAEVELGRIDSSEAQETEQEEDHFEIVKRKRPPISSIMNLFDFESVAKHLMTREAWAYYSSGAEDEITLRENRGAFQRIWLKPRVMVNVQTVNMKIKMLGQSSALPIYITATALGKLGHPEGEVVLTRAAHKRNIIQMIPTLSSCSLSQMLDARQKGQVQFLQLYVNSNRDVTRALIERAEAGGCKGLFITVDAPQLGRREKDMRMKYSADTDLQDEAEVDRNQGAARAISSFIDPSLNWEDLAWFRSVTKMPIALKGIQSGADAVIAAKSGVDAIIVSNHGGRQIDTGRSAIEILPEVVADLKEHYRLNPQKRMEIYIDGGIRRGSDVFKALALGADAVGIGRPFLYAMSTYGQAGVEKAIDFLTDELTMTMRLMGTPSISDITPSHVDARSLQNHPGQAPIDHWQQHIYEPLIPSKL